MVEYLTHYFQAAFMFTVWVHYDQRLHPYDREYVRMEPGFNRISANSTEAVTMMHKSRLAEELMLWTSQEFGFEQLGRESVTGSNIMMQKRNSDFAELSRGDTGRVYDARMSRPTMMQGSPITYHRDLMNRKFKHPFSMVRAI